MDSHLTHLHKSVCERGTKAEHLIFTKYHIITLKHATQVGTGENRIYPYNTQSSSANYKGGSVSYVL
jgi:hypothetical protein